MMLFGFEVWRMFRGRVFDIGAKNYWFAFALKIHKGSVRKSSMVCRFSFDWTVHKSSTKDTFVSSLNFKNAVEFALFHDGRIKQRLTAGMNVSLARM